MPTLESQGLNIALFGAAILVCCTGLLFTLIQQRTERKQNKAYVLLLGIVLVNAVTGLVNTFLLSGSVTRGTLVAVNIMDMIYFVSHTALCPLFYYYVRFVCGVGGGNVHKVRDRILTVMFIATEIPVVLNPFFHAIFWYDEAGGFHRGWSEIALYISAAVFMVFALEMLMFSWNALTEKRRAALVYFFLIVIIGIAVQMLFMNVKCEVFAEALALMGVMISIEDEEERIDAATGFYNRRALQTDVDTYIINKRPLHIICIKIQNSEMVKRSSGQESSEAIGLVIGDFLRSIVSRFCIYEVSPNTFILTVLDDSEDEVISMAENLSRRFEDSWNFGEVELVLNAVIIAAAVPERLKSAGDVFYMADVPIPKNIEKKILTGSDLDYLLRRAAVEEAVGKGLDGGYFEVYYQPTFYLKDRKLHGAEALLRLHDPKVGDIPPDEFIPIAEQMGLIDNIDDFVLREVCKLVKSGIPQDHHMDCINVNLSVIQCQQPGFVGHIREIVEEFGIENNRINFEITESVAASDYKLLSYVVTQLKDEGFLFSMDDYGTGYSNMQSIFSLDFDVVKIDKSILWSAEASDLGRIILENSVRMIKQMNRKILVEGVETESQIELLSKLGVDYLQGFYFSEPLPMDEFLKVIFKYK